MSHTVDFIRRCPEEKYVVFSKWGKRVLHEEMDLKAEEVSSLSTLSKIASGIADTLITRVAQVGL